MPTDLEQPAAAAAAAAATAGNKFDMADVGYTYSCSYYHIQDCRSMDFGRGSGQQQLEQEDKSGEQLHFPPPTYSHDTKYRQ